MRQSIGSRRRRYQNNGDTTALASALLIALTDALTAATKFDSPILPPLHSVSLLFFGRNKERNVVFIVKLQCELSNSLSVGQVGPIVSGGQVGDLA